MPMPTPLQSGLSAAARGLRHAALGACVLAVATFTTAAAAATERTRDLRPIAQTAGGVTVWSERCPASGRAAAAIDAFDAFDAHRRQPDPKVLAALTAALHDGDLERRGVQVVETAGGPLLKVAGRAPGDPDTYFELCDVALRTVYE
jgi:hypothetical protein